MKDLKSVSAYSTKSPYEIWQEWEEIPIYKDFIVSNLLDLELGDWQRTGGKGAGNGPGTGTTGIFDIFSTAPVNQR